jgi:hypothetical protein
MRKAQDQEKAPDGQHSADILGVFEQRKGKCTAPGNVIPQSIAVKYPHLAQAIKHTQIEHLPGDNAGDSYPKRQKVSTQWPGRRMPMHNAPTEKHREL